MDFSQYLQAGYFIDSDHPAVIEYAQTHTKGLANAKEQTIALYYQIRDEFRYDPYRVDLRKEALRASALLGQKKGFCVQKAALLAAACRALQIPARMQYFIVKNHLGTGNLEKIFGTNLIVFHGGAQIYFGDTWHKLVPAFNKDLCQKLGVAALEFNGQGDAVFQEYKGQVDDKQYMEYMHDYGVFADFPYELAMQELHKYYPTAFDASVPMAKRVAFTYWD